MEQSIMKNKTTINKAILNKASGFTLVELMIVIAIIGILAAVGYPAYTSYVTKANRADAIGGLLTLAGRMEEYYVNNDTYVGATVATLYGGTTTQEGLYTLTMTPDPTAFAYTLVATPVPADRDPECKTLTLNQLGQKGSTGTATTAECW